MIIRNQRWPLVRSIDTPWGTYTPGYEVIVLRGAPRSGIEVCLDTDGHSPSAICHEFTVQAADLFEWPADIAHGTPVGYARHRTYMEPPCEQCRTHHSLTKRAQRIRTGAQAGIKVPREFLGELLQNATLEAWAEAERLWGRATVDALLDAA